MKKLCSKCMTEKDKSKFSVQSSKPDGLQSYCKDCVKTYKSKYQKEWRSRNKEQKAIYDKTWRESNKEYNKLWKRRNRDKVNKYSYKYELSPMAKIANNCRRRTREAVLKKGWDKRGTNTFKIIGCDKETLMNHLSNRFQDGMSFENYGEWHIDHIIPLASAITKDDIIRLCHYTNLQPLWAIDNLKKGAKILPVE